MKPGQLIDRMGRREFLRRGAVTGIGLSVLPLSSAAEPARIRRVVRLGRTGLEISDIGFGTSQLRGDESLVAHALERGVNYFDTAQMYTHGSSEETLGRALRGHREDVVLTSKVVCRPSDSSEKLMRSLEGSLRRLRTDRVEIYFNHAVNDVKRLQNPEWQEFVSRAKQQGKIRFTGMSGHGGRLVECIGYALDHDLADVLLVAHNFGQDPTMLQRLTKGFDFVARQPGLPAVLARARERDVGLVAMKTLLGARLNDMRPFEGGDATFAQAAFRWVLASGHVDTLIVSMKSVSEIDEYLGASGWRRPHAADTRLLDRYWALQGDRQCRYGCGDCDSACPEGVPISEVLRVGMYARDYGEVELARGQYAAIGQAASACTTCAHQACAGACSYGLDLPGLAASAHRVAVGSTTQGEV